MTEYVILLGLFWVGSKGPLKQIRVSHTCAISHDRKVNKCKSALGWLADKGERWMPRLEKAMKDAA